MPVRERRPNGAAASTQVVLAAQVRAGGGWALRQVQGARDADCSCACGVPASPRAAAAGGGSGGAAGPGDSPLRFFASLPRSHGAIASVRSPRCARSPAPRCGPPRRRLHVVHGCWGRLGRRLCAHCGEAWWSQFRGPVSEPRASAASAAIPAAAGSLASGLPAPHSLSTPPPHLPQRNDDGEGAVSPSSLQYHPARQGPALFRANLNQLELELPGPGLAYLSLPAGPLADAASGRNTSGEAAGVNEAGVAISATESIYNSAAALAAGGCWARKGTSAPRSAGISMRGGCRCGEPARPCPPACPPALLSVGSCSAPCLPFRCSDPLNEESGIIEDAIPSIILPQVRAGRLASDALGGCPKAAAIARLARLRRLALCRCSAVSCVRSCDLQSSSSSSWRSMHSPALPGAGHECAAWCRAAGAPCVAAWRGGRIRRAVCRRAGGLVGHSWVLGEARLRGVGTCAESALRQNRGQPAVAAEESRPLLPPTQPLLRCSSRSPAAGTWSRRAGTTGWHSACPMTPSSYRPTRAVSRRCRMQPQLSFFFFTGLCCCGAGTPRVFLQASSPNRPRELSCAQLTCTHPHPAAPCRRRWTRVRTACWPPPACAALRLRTGCGTLPRAAPSIFLRCVRGLAGAHGWQLLPPSYKQAAGESASP